MHRNAVQIRVRHAQNCDMVLSRQSQFQAWLVLGAEMKESTNISWTFLVIYSSLGLNFFPKLTSQHLPFESVSLSLMAFSLVIWNSKMMEPANTWSSAVESATQSSELNEGLFSVSSVYLQGPVSWYL